MIKMYLFSIYWTHKKLKWEWSDILNDQIDQEVAPKPLAIEGKQSNALSLLW